MRHFDAWILRDPYSIWHYYSTGRRWQETIRDMIQERRICAPQVDASTPRRAVDPLAREPSPQQDCQFLQRLPPEIRLMIYRYVFGDEAVHLVQLKGKIRHVRCQHPSSSIEKHRHCCPVTPARWRVYDGRVAGHSDRMLYPHTHAQLPELLSNSSLGLLRTCRTIYLEAADIPYSNLVFDVDDLHTFVAFSLSVCPERLRCIKRLTVQWMPVWRPMAGEEHWSSIYSHTHNDRLWVLFWERVQALSGLEELRVSLDLGRFTGAAVGGVVIGGKRIRLAIDEPWVAPMLSIRGLRDFDLCVTARCDASAKNLLGDEMRRDAAQLRDHLRAVMCSPRGTVPSIDGVTLKVPEVKRSEIRSRPRLAITAA
ncbi:hypothetical protein VTN96DRAFT_8241 [Rasamsonia emersonii]|uniref:DUF7730 domain-containing protein n=1 Tax=Rasamsonia emersonii (strain ATCC 16479 / CBS 393.64 / IMI 116815) TaxID=1408163 RepID=A0A0F4Z0P6_RASE3|nr:hypothetical protein T310_2022 [Rasamsonia emersonii CBS 393.64]KKA23930.1 hypothetical protein T310_2022 [Rasamsonia emersonii CBS 393.64]